MSIEQEDPLRAARLQVRLFELSPEQRFFVLSQWEDVIDRVVAGGDDHGPKAHASKATDMLGELLQELKSVSTAASQLGVHPSSLSRRINSEAIDVVRVDNHTFITQTTINQLRFRVVSRKKRK